MSTSIVGLDVRTTILPILTGSLYTLGLGGGIYNFIDPAGGAKGFGIILPNTEPTPTETAYTKIHGIRNISNGVVGLGMLWFLQFSETCTTLTTGPVVAAAVRKVIGYSLVFGTLVAVTDGLILQEFSRAKGVSRDAVELAEKQRKGHTLIGIPIALLGLGWIYA